MAPALVLAQAGHIQFVSGEARVILPSGAARPAVKGEAVNEGETVVTGGGGSLQLKMIDEGLIAVRPDTQLRIDTYRYTGREDGTERGVFRLIKGGFRTLTGVIGRANKSNYLVRTQTATIGIRGTDHEPFFIPQPAPGESPLGTPGTYNKVNVGETFIESQGNRIDLGANQVGFVSLDPGAAPVRLDRIPVFLRATAQQRGQDERRPMRAQSSGDRRLAAGPGRPVAPGQGPGFGPGFGPPKPPTQVNAEQSFTGGGFSQAPDGTAGVGGDKSGSTIGSGAMVTGPNAGTVLVGQDGFPLAIATAGGFQYARQGAPLAASGGGNFQDSGLTVPVQWGVYAGGSIVDSQGARPADFFHFMFSPGQFTPSAVLATLSGNYSSIVTHTKFISESGAPGGFMTSASINIGSGNLTGYSIGLTDALGRGWTGCAFSCSVGSVPLATFRQSGVALTGTVTSGGTVTGNAHGIPVGPTGKGLLTSFDLKSSTGAGVTGSIAVKQ